LVRKNNKDKSQSSNNKDKVHDRKYEKRGIPKEHTLYGNTMMIHHQVHHQGMMRKQIYA